MDLNLEKMYILDKEKIKSEYKTQKVFGKKYNLTSVQLSRMCTRKKPKSYYEQKKIPCKYLKNVIEQYYFFNEKRIIDDYDNLSNFVRKHSMSEPTFYRNNGKALTNKFIKKYNINYKYLYVVSTDEKTNDVRLEIIKKIKQQIDLKKDMTFELESYLTLAYETKDLKKLKAINNILEIISK